MRVLTLQDGITAATRDDAAADLVNVQNDREKEYGVVQVEITAAGTVVLFGRLGPDMPWFTVNTYTVSSSERVTLFPQMYATIASNTGTINVRLGE
jgi:hypothetical protein